jgi:hypothetical protein
MKAVALPAEQLKVVDRAGAAQGHRDEVVVLEIELAAALDALAAVSSEDRPADFPGRQRLVSSAPSGRPLPSRRTGSSPDDATEELTPRCG